MNLLALATARIGRRRKITQQDMAALLADFAMAGLDTTNDCVEDAAPQAWAKRCKGLTCISVSAPPSDHGQPARWHGSIRFDIAGVFFFNRFRKCGENNGQEHANKNLHYRPFCCCL